MKSENPLPLLEMLTTKKDAVVAEWLARTIQTYPQNVLRFLAEDTDAFRNPLGYTLRAALPFLYEWLIDGSDVSRLSPLLDPVVRIRAVQDFSAGQAVAFIFLLKKILREVLGEENTSGLAALEGRLDDMALTAFDLFMKCREQIYEIRANEAKRRLFMRDRLDGIGMGRSRS